MSFAKSVSLKLSFLMLATPPLTQIAATAVVVHVVRRIGKDHVHAVVAEQFVVCCRVGAVATNQTVRPEFVHLARLAVRFLGQLIVVAFLILGFVVAECTVEDFAHLVFAEAGQCNFRFGLEAHDDALEFVDVPCAADLVERKVECFLFGLAEFHFDHRDRCQPLGRCCLESLVATDDYAFAVLVHVHDDRLQESKLADALAQLVHLGLGHLARVVLGRAQ